MPKNEAAELKKDIASYQLFVKLAEQYADEAIRITRRRKETQKQSRKPKS